MAQLDSRFTTHSYSPLPDQIIDLMIWMHDVEDNLSSLPKHLKDIWSQNILSDLSSGTSRALLNLRTVEYARFSEDNDGILKIHSSLPKENNSYVVDL